jgi:hypothetical protein
MAMGFNNTLFGIKILPIKELMSFPMTEFWKQSDVKGILQSISENRFPGAPLRDLLQNFCHLR